MNYDLSTAGVRTPLTPWATQYITGTRTNMVRWLSHTSDPANCCPSVTLIAGPQFDANYKAASAAGEQGLSDKRATIDHSFEKKWLEGFFSYIIDSQAPLLASLPQGQVANNIGCEDLHNFFFGAARDRTGMQDFYNEMPGGENWLSLTGMSGFLNSQAKVSFANFSERGPAANVSIVMGDLCANVQYGIRQTATSWRKGQTN